MASVSHDLRTPLASSKFYMDKSIEINEGVL